MQKCFVAYICICNLCDSSVFERMDDDWYNKKDVPAWSHDTWLGFPGGRILSVAKAPLSAPAWWSAASLARSRSRRTPLPVPASPVASPWPLILPPPKIVESCSRDKAASSAFLLPVPFRYTLVCRGVTSSSIPSSPSCVSLCASFIDRFVALRVLLLSLVLASVKTRNFLSLSLSLSLFSSSTYFAQVL